jgi:choice-of-anchor C domain-containing protein
MLAIVATLALAGTTLGVQLFQNGSFENGNYVTGNFGSLDFDRLSTVTGSTDMTGWTVTQGDIDWVGTYWAASAGTKSVDLDGSVPTAGAISQTFDTNLNSTYVITFDMSGNPDSGPAIKTMNVSAGGVTTAFTYDTSVQGPTHTNMQWLNHGVSFVAGASGSATLTFTSTTGSGYGPVIDNVVVTETTATGAACKNNGWKNMHDTLGVAFRNQGDCVSFFATGEKNLAF